MNARGLGLLCLLLTLLYLPTLGHGFHFDDHYLIEDNGFIRSWNRFPELLTAPGSSTASQSKGMFRPALMATFAWNYQTSGLNPISYHLVNVWLHLLVVCFVAGLGALLWPAVRFRWILMATALWAVHPIHTEAVAYVSSRSSVLATLWMVMALWLYLQRRRWATAGSLVCYALALGSKEIAVTLPGLLLLVEWAVPLRQDQRERPGRRTVGILFRLAPFLALTAGYLLWRRIVVGAVGAIHPARPWGENSRVVLEGILHYLGLWCWPANLSVVPPQPDGAGLGLWISAAVLAGLGAAGWACRRRFPGVAFGLGWAGVTFLPPAFASALNLPVAEHHAYLPSVGFALGLPPLLQKLSSVRGEPVEPRTRSPFNRLRANGGLILIYFSLIAVLSVATFRRIPAWRDEFTLWSDAARKNPTDAMIQNNLGIQYPAREQWEEAFNCFARALRLATHTHHLYYARNHLGNLYTLTGQPEEGLAQFRRCLALKPFGPEVFHNMGIAHRHMGEWAEAEGLFLLALDDDPWYIPAYVSLGGLYLQQDRLEEAERVFERAAALSPEDPGVWLPMGKFYLASHRVARAESAFRKMAQLRSEDPTALLYLAVCALRADPPRPAEADRHLARAVELGWEPDEEFLAGLARLRTAKPEEGAS